MDDVNVRFVGNIEPPDQHGVWLFERAAGGTWVVVDSAGASSEEFTDLASALREFADYCETFAEGYTEAEDTFWADRYLEAANEARKAAEEPQEATQEDSEEPVVSAIHDADSGPHSGSQSRAVEDVDLPEVE